MSTRKHRIASADQTSIEIMHAKVVAARAFFLLEASLDLSSKVLREHGPESEQYRVTLEKVNSGQTGFLLGLQWAAREFAPLIISDTKDSNITAELKSLHLIEGILIELDKPASQEALMNLAMSTHLK